MGILVDTKNVSLYTKKTYEEITNAAKELMQPFMDRYMQDLLNDEYPVLEDFEDLNCDICGSSMTIDITVEYTTYNNGSHVDPKVHGEPIRLEISKTCPKCDKS